MRRGFVFSISLFLLLLSVSAKAQNTAPMTITREKVLARNAQVVDKSVQLFPLRRGVGKVFEQFVPQRGASSFRMHFHVQSPTQAPTWTVQVLDKNRLLVWTYKSADSPATDFWSGEVRGDKATVIIISDEANSPLRLTVDRVAVSTPMFKPQSLTPPDSRAPILSQPAGIKEMGKSVARLRFVGDDGIGYVCTGFLISGDLLMTNHHCPQSESEWRSTLVDFDYDSASAAPVVSAFKELIVADQRLDFAIFRLVANPGRQPLPLDTTAPPESKPLLIIEHPGGEPKQVSIIDCRVQGAQVSGVSADLTDFGHLCDTLGGSSGSPVMDLATSRVIGLHHLGFNDRSPQLINRAVNIREILDYIRANRPEILPQLGVR